VHRLRQGAPSTASAIGAFAAPAAVVALCGCGAAGHVDVRQASPSPAAPAAQSRKAAQSPVSVAPATAPSGLRSADGSRAKAVGRESFRALAAGQCAAAIPGVAGAVPGLRRSVPGSPGPRSPSPPPLGAPPPAAIARSAGVTIVQRRIEALSRLRPPASMRRSLAGLVSVLRRLQQLYLAEGRGQASLPPGVVAAVELEAADAASAAGVPACAPSPVAPVSSR
jgi:hypothetical protein